MTSTEKTLRHIKRVQDLLGRAAAELVHRGEVHDASKLDPIEAGPLAEMDALIERDGNVPFGSQEYETRKAMLGPMLANHYAMNSHHPEHYPNGVDGMDLFDILEMFVDWKAASERGGQSSMGIAAGVQRYQIADQLAAIFRNTADRLGWTHE
jgi:hypothetical protein